MQRHRLLETFYYRDAGTSRMIEHHPGQLGEGMKILEVGAGTGCNAALLAEIVGGQCLVVTVDVPEQAPFDRIVATVGCSDLSPRWAEQLADDGAMLVPLQHASGHPLVLARKDGGVLRGRMVLRTGFIPVRGPLPIEAGGDPPPGGPGGWQISRRFCRELISQD